MSLQFRAGEFNFMKVELLDDYVSIKVTIFDIYDKSSSVEWLDDYASREESEKAFYGLLRLMKGELIDGN